MAFSKEFYLQLFLIILTSLIARVCVSMWGYSGQDKPPRFGDLEAQRHWMEITVNLPVEDWYVQGRYNDLKYWGLDYPPLTAYHMMINGKIANYINSSMVALRSSQGLEDPQLKFFMRSTVLAMDVLLFLPAVALYFMFNKSESDDENETLGFILVLAAYPGLLLIDNGHFQYNNTSLAMLILATLAINWEKDVIATLLFCCAVNYKQMELFHALSFFAYLLGTCIRADVYKGVLKLVILTLVVLFGFAAIWSPFLSREETAIAVVQRLFPFKRGLFEDMVSNFWYSISFLINFKNLLYPSDMALLVLIVTSVLLLPSLLYLLKNPTVKCFHYALINASLIFFMFSFQVHEKSILLAAIPSCFVVKTDPLTVFWLLLISVFSMLPLLLKDGLLIPTIATVCIFWITVSHFLRPTNSVSPDIQRSFELSMLVAVCIAVAAVFIPPPRQFPEIFHMLISIYSFGHFIFFAINFHIRQFDAESYFHHITHSTMFKTRVEVEAYKSDRSPPPGRSELWVSVHRITDRSDVKQFKL